MAQALGVRFLDADGQVLVANGGNLARVASIEMDECDPRLANCHIEVACDVDNPLVGARGAAAVFGPQKGQRRKWSKSWNRGCKITPVFYNSKLKSTSARWRAAALRAVWVLRRRYFSMRILNRIEIVLNAVNLAQAVQGAALVITGKGASTRKRQAVKRRWVWRRWRSSLMYR